MIWEDANKQNKKNNMGKGKHYTLKVSMHYFDTL